MCLPLLILFQSPALTPSISVGVLQLFSTPGLAVPSTQDIHAVAALFSPQLPAYLAPDPPGLPLFCLLQPPNSHCFSLLFAHHALITITASQAEFSLSPLAFASCLTSDISLV